MTDSPRTGNSQPSEDAYKKTRPNPQWMCPFAAAEFLALLWSANRVFTLPSLRVVFVLRDIQGLSTRETSEVLDISEMAVKTRLSRARLRLREELSTYYGERVVERKQL